MGCIRSGLTLTGLAGLVRVLFFKDGLGSEKPMKIQYVPFSKLPYTDTCWSLIEGPDERAYAVACCEHSSGGTGFITRYDPATRRLEYLLDVAETVGQPSDNGRATQCKIHYSMVADDDGILYAATHLSGPAIDQPNYNPWGTFDDPLRSFVGSQLLAYDIARDKVLWTDTLIPHEGCRCFALDRQRRLLYAVGYPRDHFYVYQLDSRRRTDLGRIGSVNPQAIWMDQRGRAYTTDDYGRIIVCQPADGGGWRLIDTDTYAPHAIYQNGWHNVAYDVVAVPGTDAVAGAAWNVDPHLFLLTHHDELADMKMENLGPSSPGIDGYGDRGFNGDHCGGLVFSAGGELLYCASLSDTSGSVFPSRSAMLKAINLQTHRVRDICQLTDNAGVEIPYISRTIRIGPRHLVMGVVGQMPTGILHVELDGELAQGPLAATPRRYWG